MTRLLALAATAFLATGCDGKWVRGGWPSPITTQGDNSLGVWQGALITAGCVGVFVIGLILASAVLFRRRSPDDLPRQVRYNLPIEVLYTVVPVIMIAVLFYFTAIRENDHDKLLGHTDMRVGVVGFQWSWQFIYPDDNLAVTGQPSRLPTLVLPVGKTVEFDESSPDVIHSFWVVPFLFKRDVVPGHPNSFAVKLTHTGTFAGKCTELCGIDHDRMLFTLKVVSESDYQQWLASTQQKAAAGTDPMFSTYDGALYGKDVVGQTQRSHE
ncbi:MAG TPA: cytochrome c oxidase subunit II [Mycobacteriales bacterium]|nr:cytochrome c oxidase subunit II [Mycobacteriales bacterium]